MSDLTPSWYVRPLLDREPRLAGPDVETVQRKVRLVNEEGYGPMSAAKVRGFQWMKSLPQTGVVDPETAKALGE